jgi:hypothetical protein
LNCGEKAMNKWSLKQGSVMLLEAKGHYYWQNTELRRLSPVLRR